MWDFVALLFGVGAVFALYFSARNADTRIATANERASSAAERAAVLENEAAQLRERNLAFEQALSPRILEQNLTGQRLKQFADVEVVVQSELDGEPRRLAGEIRYLLLGSAGWKRFSGTLPSFHISEGVVVHTAPLIIALHDEAARAIGLRTQEAAEALIRELQNNGIAAREGYPMRELGAAGMLVLVGLKPVPPTLQRRPEDIPADARENKEYGNTME
jgi:hypothetical protein